MFRRLLIILFFCFMQFSATVAVAIDCQYLLSKERQERIPAYSDGEVRIVAVETLLLFLYDHPLIHNLRSRHLTDRDVMSLFHLTFGYQDNTQIMKSEMGRDRANFDEAILTPHKDLHASGSPLPPHIDIYSNMLELMKEARRPGGYAVLREHEREGLIDTLYETTMRLWKVVSSPSSWRFEGDSELPILNVTTRLYSHPGDDVMIHLRNIRIFTEEEWAHIHHITEIAFPDDPTQEDVRRARSIERIVKDYLRLYLPELLSARGMTLLMGMRSNLKMAGSLTERNIIRRSLNRELLSFIQHKDIYMPEYAPYVLPKPFEPQRFSHLANLNFERLLSEVPKLLRSGPLQEILQEINGEVEPNIEILRKRIESYESDVSRDLHNIETLRRKAKFQIRSLQNRITRHLEDLEDQELTDEQTANLPTRVDTIPAQVQLGQELLDVENMYADQLTWFERVQNLRMMIVNFQIQRSLEIDVHELESQILVTLKEMAAETK